MRTAPFIVAHRGASSDAPENTLAAFRRAWEHGADAVEADLHLTADGHAVCCHDETLARTGGVDRAIREMTLEEISAVDVGRWRSERFAGERVPTLAGLLASVPVGKSIYLEVKSGAETLGAMRADIDRSTVSADQIRIIGFDAGVMAAAKRAMPGIKTHWLCDAEPRPTLASLLTRLRASRADALGMEADRAVIDAALVAALKAAGYATHVWTVDDPDAARHFAAIGVASITTNRARAIREALAF